MIQKHQEEINNCLLQIPHSQNCSSENALSYTMLIAEIDQQQQNARKDCFQLSQIPRSERLISEKGNKTEYLDSFVNDDKFQRSQNIDPRHFLNHNRLFPPNFNHEQIDKQIQERVLNEDLLEQQKLPDILTERRRSIDRNDQKDFLNVEQKQQKKLNGAIIKSYVRNGEVFELGQIEEQSQIINKVESCSNQSHFKEASIDQDCMNIFKRFQQPKVEAPMDDHYQIRISATREQIKKPSQPILASIGMSSKTFGAEGNIRSQVKSKNRQEANKAIRDELKAMPIAQMLIQKDKLSLHSSNDSKLKAFDHKMMVKSKIITADNKQKDNEINKNMLDPKNHKVIQDSKKTLVQVASRMKYTYDPKIPSSDFKNDHLSEPDMHECLNTAKDNPKLIEQISPSLTQQQKKKNDMLKDNIQVQLRTKLDNIQKLVDNLKENPSHSAQIEKSKLFPYQKNFEKPIVKSKKQIKRGYKIETLKSMTPDDLFNGFSSIESNKSKKNGKLSEKTQLKEEINSKFQFLAQRILKIEEALLKKVTRQSHYGPFDSQFQGNQQKRVIKFNYKNCNSQTKLLSRAKSQSKINQLNFEDDFMSDDDIANLQDSLPEINFSLLQNSSPEELGEVGVKILDAFKIQTEKGGSMDMVEYENCVQYYYTAINLFIRWEFSGLLYIGRGIVNQYPMQFTKQGKGMQIMPNKHIFKGQFHLNKKHGMGIISNLKGDKYKGSWENDLYEGFGKLYTATSKYKGEFHEGKKHGTGRQKFKNGNSYEGSYYLDSYNGTGKYRWKNGAVYYGYFQKDEMTGQGVWKSAYGDTYEGQFYKNKRHGYGRYTTREGHVIEGEFSKGELIKNKCRGIIPPENQLTFDAFDSQVSRGGRNWQFAQKYNDTKTKRFVVQKQSSHVSPIKSKKVSTRW